MKLTKSKFLLGFFIVVIVLALVRCLNPNVASSSAANSAALDSTAVDAEDSELIAEYSEGKTIRDTVNDIDDMPVLTDFFTSDGAAAKHRIFSVPNFGRAFPDQQDVQLESANRWGMQPVRDRVEAEKRKDRLVYIGSNPYYYVENLHSSIPYLVPRAAVLLQDIGRNFFDSLQIKGIPLHKIIITSVMRSENDVENLRSHNGNATRNSCHMYGTTFDVSYNRYKTVETQEQPQRKVRNDTLKWVLSEALRDARESNRCYVKYEVHQGCFHITVR